MLRWRTDRIQIKIPPSFTTMLHKLTYLHNFWKHFITARKQSWQRLCFHRCLSVHRGVSAPLHTGIHPLDRHPTGRHPPDQRQTPPLCSACWDTVNKRAVRIPLECILVNFVLVKVHSFVGCCHCKIAD